MNISEEINPCLTIITPVKEYTDDIQNLALSLNCQSDKNFVWLIVDGGDNQVAIEDLLKKIIIKTIILRKKDFSIYDALNNGVRAIQTKYYAVAGIDDFFEKNFVAILNNKIKSDDWDFVFGSVRMNDKIIAPKLGMSWYYGMHGLGSSHSIGTVINKRLHGQFGFYSNLYPVAADQYFVMKAIKNGAKSAYLNVIFGTYGGNGFSNKFKMDYAVDFYKVQISINENKIVQLILLMMRLLKLSFNIAK